MMNPNSNSNFKSTGLKFNAPRQVPQQERPSYSQAQYQQQQNDPRYSRNPQNGYPQTSQPAQTQQKPQTNAHTTEWTASNAICSVFAKDTVLTFSKSALALYKKDKNGVRKNLNGKVMVEFFSFDQSHHQMNYIPVYLDVTTFKGINLWLNSYERIIETENALNAQANGGYAYAAPLKTTYGGSSKPIYRKNGQIFGGNGRVYSTVFKIAPAKKQNSYLLSAECYPASVSQTGAMSPVKGAKPEIRVMVPIGLDELRGAFDLVNDCILSELTIERANG